MLARMYIHKSFKVIRKPIIGPKIAIALTKIKVLLVVRFKKSKAVCVGKQVYFASVGAPFLISANS